MRPGSRVHILRAVQFGNPAPLAAAPNTGSHSRTQSWCELFPPLAQRAWLDAAHRAAV